MGASSPFGMRMTCFWDENDMRKAGESQVGARHGMKNRRKMKGQRWGC